MSTWSSIRPWKVPSRPLLLKWFRWLCKAWSRRIETSKALSKVGKRIHLLTWMLTSARTYLMWCPSRDLSKTLPLTAATVQRTITVIKMKALMSQWIYPQSICRVWYLDRDRKFIIKQITPIKRREHWKPTTLYNLSRLTWRRARMGKKSFIRLSTNGLKISIRFISTLMKWKRNCFRQSIFKICMQSRTQQNFSKNETTFICTLKSHIKFRYSVILSVNRT